MLLIILAGCVAIGDNPSTSPDSTWAAVKEGSKDVAANSENGTAQNETAQNQAVAGNDIRQVNEYNINIEVKPDSRIVTGVEKFLYTNSTGESLDKLYFHVYLNAFGREVRNKPYFDSFESRVFPDGVIDYGYMNIFSITSQNSELDFSMDETILTVYLNEPLEANANIEIAIDFDSYIPLINHRTGANEYAMWFGNFFPALAVYDGKGWHLDPYYPAGDPFYTNVANYDVTVVTPAGYTVVATGTEATNETDMKRTTRITARMVRDFAFAISDRYDSGTIKTASGKYVNLYTYSPLENKDEVLEIAKESLDYFSNTVGAYSDTSLDIAEIGYFTSGGMEYPAIIFIDSSRFDSGANYTAIAHEIGHQWFYSLVGNDQINEPWLDEGLTTFLQLGIFYTESEIAEMMSADYQTLSDGMKKLQNVSLRDNLSVFNSWKDYTSVHFTRAKLMLYSLKLKMGTEKFDHFIKTYCAKYSYKTATSADFIGVAQEIYGEDLTGFFNGWMEGRKLPPLE